MNAFLSLIAAAMTIAAALLLREGWRARRAGHMKRRLTLMLSAWSLLLLSFIPWTFASGADRGIAFGITVFMLAGFVLVLMAARESNGSRKRAEREPRTNGNGNGASELSGTRLLLRRIYVFLLAGPISAVIALLVTANAFAWWNVETGSAANRLAAALLIMPIAWALLAIWTTYDVSLRRRSLVAFGLAAMSVAGIALEMM
ncbi:MAG TPA: hypothetical protein VF275_13135 [Gammaproteobacteria bacterium]